MYSSMYFNAPRILFSKVKRMSDSIRDQSKPIISVLTPSWNRARYLERVWRGLNSQTFRDFEWIVGDDGSDDDTQAVIRELAALSDFPVIVVTASVHVGKIRMDNEAVKLARGEFIIWNDSDDYFVPEAFHKFLEAWTCINENERDKYVSVSSLCKDEYGLTSSELPQEGIFDTTWNELYEKHSVQGDMSYFIRADLLKATPFPEVDFVIPEGVVWTALGDELTRILPEPLLIKQYRSDHCISFSGRMNYCRGYAYSMAVSERALKKYRNNYSKTIRNLINFIRLSIHGDVSVRMQWQQWSGNTSKFAFYAALPFAWALSLKDRIQGKVVKSHIAFDKVKETARISVNKFNRN